MPTVRTAIAVALPVVIAAVLAHPTGSAARPTATGTGPLITVTGTVARDTSAHDTDYLTVTLTLSVARVTTTPVRYSLSGTGGITFASPSGSVSILAGATSARVTSVVFFPPLVGNQSIVVSTSTRTGSPVQTTPAHLTVAAASPLGPGPTPGYWLATTAGGVFSFNTQYHGSVMRAPTVPIVGMAELQTGNGYWLATSAGVVYPFAAPNHGELKAKPLSPIVAIANDPATGGYWLFSAGGAVYPFDAPTFGQVSNPVAPIVSAAAAPDGRGYWLVTKTGTVYALGPGAKNHGGASKLAAPIVSMAADLHTGGYWLLTQKGVVYAFDAPKFGSANGGQATSISPDPATQGYWISIADGAVYAFGAKYYGSATPYHPASPVIAVLGR